MRRHELSDENGTLLHPYYRPIPAELNVLTTAESSWRDVPERYGPRTTLYNRFSRWREAGVWDRLLAAVSKRYDGDVMMIDSSCVRVHQHGANAKKGDLPILAWDVRVAA